MPPAGLLAIIALGMVLAYVIPQRIRERADYALVRTEDRYSAEMRVVKTTASRVERPVTRASSDSGEVPLLVTGAARASIASLGADAMSRPAGPIDKAATTAQRQLLAMRSDRATALVERRARARRRARVALGVTVLAAAAWVLVAFGLVHAVVGAVVTALLAGVLVQGARAAAAQRRVDARLSLVAREVGAAATATQALRKVTADRAAGRESQPSDVETQAIKIVTSADLAPLSAPAPMPFAKVTTSVEPVAQAAAPEESAAWSPRELPAPSYTLKAEVRPAQARPLDTGDIAAASYRAEEGEGAPAAPATGSLDAILARRRSASA
ncbi:hypothetical protein QQX09_06685 [Demequina sp. SYSU T00192]|uniref:Uncharacterized protein n=1 Tax=Demequina litoralis TaxID=3051660 RepID=A0ABT8G965_9MICO|nr:hypothetical protein [Demequina sp. SYSU T00192]MDN4475537.1 hypothetical protein [Demequina sp. SYSU T00192]